MANIKSAKKRVLIAEANRVRNVAFKTSIKTAVKKALALAIKGLPTRNQQVLALYYDEELNLKEIGKVLDLSESRISQLLSESMARLRSALKDWSTI